MVLWRQMNVFLDHKRSFSGLMNGCCLRVLHFLRFNRYVAAEFNGCQSHNERGIERGQFSAGVVICFMFIAKSYKKNA